MPVVESLNPTHANLLHPAFSKMTNFLSTFISQISCLSFENKYLFAANSSELLVYRNEELLKSIKLQKKIHFVKVFKENIFCVSGKQLTRIKVLHWDKFNLGETIEIGAIDWIVSLEILDDHSIVLLFANNFIHHYSADMKLLNVLHSTELLLYCGHIVGRNYESILIASGTIMNTCIIWNTRDAAKRKLIGHEGVILGVEFNNDLTEILTVSDDRTVRLYNLSKFTNLLDDEGFEVVSNSLVFKGHSGRVWKAKFAERYIISVSEDATCRIWDRNKQTCLSVLEGHGFKNVWSLAVDPTNSIIVKKY